MKINDLFLKFNDIILNLHNKYEWFSLQTPQSSITNTELFYIYIHIVQHKCPLIFESGIGTGRSTLILSECMKEYGEVIAAYYRYPGDSLELKSFENDYSNLKIIAGKGEDVIDLVTKDVSLICVIDDPKPSGELHNRPGWKTLITKLHNYHELLYSFQHDTNDAENWRIFSMVEGFQKEYISRYFLKTYTLYGAVEIWKMFKPNLGKMTLIK